jgi:hypothetical protein
MGIGLNSKPKHNFFPGSLEEPIIIIDPKKISEALKYFFYIYPVGLVGFSPDKANYQKLYEQNKLQNTEASHGTASIWRPDGL